MIFINNQSDLNNFCQLLKGSEFITVDTEFSRDKTYYPKLCLIQIANVNHAAVIDPLVEGVDLSSLSSILFDDNILKIFHSARQDIEIIYNIFSSIPKPIFDTQIAAMFCGFEENIGYDTLVHKLLGIKLDKALQYTDWLNRPLSAAQIKYAIEDVTYLRNIYLKLKSKLQKQKREEWIIPEIAILTNKETYDVDLDKLVKKINHKNSKPKFLYLIKQLIAWREDKAKKYDIPRKHFMKDEKIIEIAELCPNNIEQVKKIKNIINKYISEKIMKEILKIVESSENKILDNLDSIKDEIYSDNSITTMFNILLKSIAKDARIIPRLIISKQELQKLINSNDLDDLNVMYGWKYELFGKYALRLKKGEIALTLEKSQIKIIDLKN